MRGLLPFMLMMWVGHASAQVDSLLGVLETLPKDTSRLPLLTEVLRHTIYTDPDSALVFAAQYRDIAARSGMALEQGKGDNYTGMCHSFLGEHDRALQYYQSALRHFEMGDDPWYTAMAHNNIASVLESEERLGEAMAEYRTARAGFQDVKDTAWVANVTNNLANVLHAHGALDSSVVYYHTTDSILVGLGQHDFAAQVRMNLANVLYELEQPMEALHTMRNALAIHTAEGDEVNKANLLLGLGRMQGVNDFPDSAFASLRAGLAMAQRTGAREVEVEGELFLSDLFEQHGRMDSAFVHFKRMKVLVDSLLNEARVTQIAEMRERYESGRKDALIAENRAQLEQRTITIRAIAGGAVLLLIAAIFAFRAYRIKRKGAAELAGKNAVISAQLKEKELLVREIHHRVKNNLQVVSSLLSIQGRGIADPAAKQAVNDGRLRVKSMALIHQDLYREGDLTGVRMKEYVDKLAAGLITGYSMTDRVVLRSEVEDLELDVDTAVPIGLILNELITNALKYAWPGGGQGTVTVTLGVRPGSDPAEGDAMLLQVRDDGVGDTSKVPSTGSSGFGLNMIKTFAVKLKAEWTVKQDGGTVARLVIRNFKLART